MYVVVCMRPLDNSNDDQRADSRITFTGRLIGGGHPRHYRGKRYGQEREEDHLGRTRLDGHGCRADRQRADGRVRHTGPLIGDEQPWHCRGGGMALTTAHIYWPWIQRWGRSFRFYNNVTWSFELV